MPRVNSAYEREKKILDFWRREHIFERSLAQHQSHPRFVFFEGPPTANGLPHIGHFLTRVFKDIYGRYKTMQGYFVLRKAGWDTHGLPVEIEVERELGFKNKKDIERYGIAKFNQKAKQSVWKYKKEWEEMTGQMGFWIDLDNPYITYQPDYIETLWWIIKKIHDQGLLYQAQKVVPYCPRCGTALSSHEVAQGYKTITDKSAVVKFPIINYQFSNRPDIPNTKTYILAWTTTLWTLPGNIALTVGEDITYVVAQKDGTHFIVAKDRARQTLGDSFKIVAELTGKDLVGLSYEPLFEIPQLKSEASYKVYAADFVNTAEGTGIVHTAVMYGEDDYNLGTKIDLPKVHTVDESGKFVNILPKLNGCYVKTKKTEETIVKLLGDKILKIESYEHEYPFCWRCEEPLLYYARNAWLVNMQKVKKKLLANNQKINWHPAYMKEGRFGEWLAEVKDWNFSRDRYWGTPLPIWRCEQSRIGRTQSAKRKAQSANSGCDATLVIGSLSDMAEHRFRKNNAYILMRHGLSERNEIGDKIIINSQPDQLDAYPLTAQGKRQIELTAEKMAASGSTIDAIYASPFRRTRETAQIIARKFGLTVQLDERLAEIHHGPQCEGKAHVLCPMEDISKKSQNFNEKHPGGESTNNVRRRAFNFINDLEQKYDGKTILIVSHGDPLLLLDAASRGLTETEIVQRRRQNASWYPKIGEWRSIGWHFLPRNDFGERDLHRPFVDEIVLKCPACGNPMSRVRELADVWFDSGAMPYAQWHWPFENQEMIDPPTPRLRKASQFPADFIVEAVDQTRGWFYTLLAVATLLNKGAPYKNVISLGHVLDEKGQKLSKSKKNYKSPFELMKQFGVDTLRWYFYTINAPWEPTRFIERDVKNKQAGFLRALENSLRFWQLYGTNESQRIEIRSRTNLRLPTSNLSLLDKWILSRLNTLVKEITEKLDAYDVTYAARAIENFVIEDLSNWWIRRSRNRFQVEKSADVRVLLTHILLTVAKLTAPFIPFLSETIFQAMANPTTVDSIHLADWPTADNQQIDVRLEAEMSLVRKIVSLGLAARKQANIKIRQPLSRISINIKKSSASLGTELEQLLKDELNIKEIDFRDTVQKETPTIVSSEDQIAVTLDTDITFELRQEGWVREIMRGIQDLRKDAAYSFDQKVHADWFTRDADLKNTIERAASQIKVKTLLSQFEFKTSRDRTYDAQIEFQPEPQRTIWIAVRA